MKTKNHFALKNLLGIRRAITPAGNKNLNEKAKNDVTAWLLKNSVMVLNIQIPF